MTDQFGEHSLYEEEAPVVKNEKPVNRNRGFRTMSREKRKEVSSMGGKAAHKQGLAHTWTSEEAREAGRKGGTVSRRKKKSV